MTAGASLVFANLETPRVVGDPAAVDDRLGVALRYELGCSVDAYGARPKALADLHLCRPSKRYGAAAVLTEQPPRRRRASCS